MDVDFREIGTGRSVFPARRLNKRRVNLKGESLGGLLFGYFLLAAQEKVTHTEGVKNKYAKQPAKKFTIESL